MTDRFRLVPAAYLYLLRRGADGDEVLLQLRAGTGYRDGQWACAAAGHVEAGESVVATAVREAREELGIGVESADVRPLTVLHRTDGSPTPIEQRVDFMFTTRAWAGEPTIAEPLKCAGLRWWPLTGLPEPMVPHERDVLRALAAGPVPVIWAHGFAP